MAGLPERLAGPVDLFVRRIAGVRALCAVNDVALSLVLLPGRSCVEAPDTLSATFQDELRRQILAKQADLGTPLIDLAAQLASLYANSGEALFHQHEGHPNPAGHEAVAELLLASVMPRGTP
ncbi:MAG: hypothetical protein OEW88_05765 [Gammaproteobacteria bacterium]|nr:hypothetical protein [Gammaproteobacteria bacterium]